MASIQRIVSPLTGEVIYRAQVRCKGRHPESATFPNRKEAVAWAESVETSIREGRYFPHAAAKRTSFDALVNDYIETVLSESALRSPDWDCWPAYRFGVGWSSVGLCVS